MKNISRILIANRGEIAVRILKTCKALGIEAVLAVSEADKKSLPAKMADRVICIGPSPPKDSYLKIEYLISAALGTHSDAIHPGYGFLSEDPMLAAACEENGLIFIGPSAETVQQMGNKLQARKIAKRCGINDILGSEKINDHKEAIMVAEKIGLPVMIKAAAGGGGRGMTIVKNIEELKAVFDILSTEVRSAFGDGTLFIERYFPNSRHIEVQILGDHFGNVIHLGERDCSIQRRYQKIIEESPCTVISPEFREEICNSAVTIAKEIKYDSCGTVEFILDQDANQFYFLEVNTRIQVEHPVTEQISGVDIIEEQIRSAALEPLRISQEEVTLTGHAIECRINAESSDGSFQPSPGRIQKWVPPRGPGIRVDTHCDDGYLIPPFYDSLIAKLITTGSDRLQAINRMQSALESFSVTGVDTTIPFLRVVLKHPDYVRSNINTRWLEGVFFKN